MKPGGEVGAPPEAPRGLWTKVKEARHRDGVRLAGGSAFLFACRIFGAASVYLTQAVISRHLGDEGLGQYALSFSWCLVVTEIALIGVPSAAVRFVGAGLAVADEEHLGTVRGFVRRTRQITSATTVLAAGLAALGGWLFLPPGGLRTSFLIAMAGVPVMASLRLYGSFALAGSWLVHFSLPNNVLRPGIFLALGAIALRLWPGTDVPRLLVIHMGITALIAVFSTAMIARRLHLRFRDAAPRYETRLWMRTATPLLLVSLATAYFPDVATITLGRFLPHEGIAQFAAAFRTAFFIGFGAIAVDSASLPRFSAAFGRGDMARLQREVTRATALKTAGALFGFAVLWIFGDRILSLFGAEYVASHGALLVLAAAQVVPALLGPGAQLLGVTGHQRDGQTGSVGGLLALPVLLALLSPRFGVLGAAWAVFLVTSGMALWLRTRIVRQLGIRPDVFTSALRSGSGRG